MEMGGGGSGVRVVIINTQYVKTDAVSFKSFVQNLTGKDARTLAVKRQRQCQFGVEVAAVQVCKAPVVERVISFKDLDKMLEELPLIDELYSLFSDN